MKKYDIVIVASMLSALLALQTPSAIAKTVEEEKKAAEQDSQRRAKEKAQDEKKAAEQASQRSVKEKAQDEKKAAEQDVKKAEEERQELKDKEENKTKDAKRENERRSTRDSNLLAPIIGGKLFVNATIGYNLNFGADWARSDGQATKSPGTHTYAYGASVGYQHLSGIGLSVDYAGWGNKWSTNTTAQQGKYPGKTDYRALYNIISLTPSYNIKLDENGYWGIKLGVGFGVSLSRLEVNYQGQANTQDFFSTTPDLNTKNFTWKTADKAKDNIGFVIIPQASVNYNNGIIHADINAKYFYGVKDVRYAGDAPASSAGADIASFTQRSGQLALFVGAGVGLNF